MVTRARLLHRLDDIVSSRLTAAARRVGVAHRTAVPDVAAARRRALHRGVRRRAGIHRRGSTDAPVRAGTGRRGPRRRPGHRDGWLAIVTAFAARCGRRGGSDRAPRSFPTLAAEVLLTEPPSSAAFLAAAAQLPWITPELVDHLGLGDADGLADIAMVPAPPVAGAVAVSPRLRDHLLGTAELGVSVRHRAAPWYEARGWLPEALWCLAGADRPSELAAFVARAGGTLLSTGHAADIAAALDLLTTNAERDPFSEGAYLGAIASLRQAGHHGSAQRLYGSYVSKLAELDVEPAMFPAA